MRNPLIALIPVLSPGKLVCVTDLSANLGITLDCLVHETDIDKLGIEPGESGVSRSADRREGFRNIVNWRKACGAGCMGNEIDTLGYICKTTVQ
jgi:hypothetical protein